MREEGLIQLEERERDKTMVLKIASPDDTNTTVANFIISELAVSYITPYTSSPVFQKFPC